MHIAGLRIGRLYDVRRHFGNYAVRSYKDLISHDVAPGILDQLQAELPAVVVNQPGYVDWLNG